MRSFLDAVTFLTRLPLPVDHRRPVDLARAAVWFPAVGAVLGTVLVGVGAVLSGWTSLLVAAVIVVALEVVLTGALHLDGLADLADGSGGRDRDARLRIMKDPATGVYGATAVVLALLLEVGLLVDLLGVATGATSSGAQGWLASGWLRLLLVSGAAWSLSRAAMLPVALLLPYARAEGTGRRVVEGLTVRSTALGWAAPVLLCVPLGLVGLVMLTGAVAGGTVVAWTAHRLLGGATGDVLGATAQVALLGALLGATVAL